MIKNPQVSVIIPSFNAERYLPDAINSLLTQTIKDFEIIVVNDGSTDDTIQVLKKYGDSIRVINQDNQGESSARNTGIFHSRGDYVSFLDADDISIPHRLEIQSNFLNTHPEIGFVGSDLFYIDRNNKTIGYQHMPISDLAIRWQGLLTLPCYNIMIRKHILEKNNIHYPVGIPYAPDYSFEVDLLQHAMGESIPQPLFGYRMHDSNEINRGLESRLSFHVPIAQRAILLELGILIKPDDKIKKLIAIMLEGVRHYPFNNNDRKEISEVYLELWQKFKNKYKGDDNIRLLQKDFLIRAATIALYPPLPIGWIPILKKLLAEDKRLPLYLLGNIPQFVKNMRSSDIIRKSHL